MEESEKWMAKATSDLATARYNLEGDMLDAALFYSQQAAEKALKSLIIQSKNDFPKIHDVVRLAKLVGAPQKIIVLCSIINPAYILSRYPDQPSRYTRAEAAAIVKNSEEVVAWAKKKKQ